MVAKPCHVYAKVAKRNGALLENNGCGWQCCVAGMENMGQRAMTIGRDVFEMEFIDLYAWIL